MIISIIKNMARHHGASYFFRLMMEHYFLDIGIVGTINQILHSNIEMLISCIRQPVTVCTIPYCNSFVTMGTYLEINITNDVKEIQCRYVDYSINLMLLSIIINFLILADHSLDKESLFVSLSLTVLQAKSADIVNTRCTFLSPISREMQVVEYLA